MLIVYNYSLLNRGVVLMVIGRASLVRIKRKESFWFNQIGSVASVDKSKVNYPILVRFESVNYSGTNTNSFALNELEEVKKEKK